MSTQQNFLFPPTTNFLEPPLMTHVTFKYIFNF